MQAENALPRLLGKSEWGRVKHGSTAQDSRQPSKGRSLTQFCKNPCRVGSALRPPLVRRNSQSFPSDLRQTAASSCSVMSSIDIQIVGSFRRSGDEGLAIRFHFPIRAAFAAMASRLNDAMPRNTLTRFLMDATRAERVRAVEIDAASIPASINWTFDEVFFDRLLKTFEGKDLIRQVPPPRHTSRRSWYWRLTGTGRVELARLQSLI